VNEYPPKSDAVSEPLFRIHIIHVVVNDIFSPTRRSNLRWMRGWYGRSGSRFGGGPGRLLSFTLRGWFGVRSSLPCPRSAGRRSRHTSHAIYLVRTVAGWRFKVGSYFNIRFLFSFRQLRYECNFLERDSLLCICDVCNRSFTPIMAFFSQIPVRMNEPRYAKKATCLYRLRISTQCLVTYHDDL